MLSQIHHMGSLYDPHILLLARQIPFDLEMHVCVAPYLRIFFVLLESSNRFSNVSLFKNIRANDWRSSKDLPLPIYNLLSFYF